MLYVFLVCVSVVVWHVLCIMLYYIILYYLYAILFDVEAKNHPMWSGSFNARLAVDYPAYSMVICQVIDKLKLVLLFASAIFDRKGKNDSYFRQLAQHSASFSFADITTLMNTDEEHHFFWCFEKLQWQFAYSNDWE